MIDQAAKLRQLIEKNRGARPLHSASAGSGTATSVKKPLSSCRTIAVTSGKGGVGKSNLSLMISIALAGFGKSVLLLDADLGLANIHLLLGIAPGKTIGDLLEDQTGAADIIVKGPGGVAILPGASGLESMANLEPLRLEMLKRKLAALEDSYDFLMVDTGAGISRSVTAFCASADTTLLVLTPEPTSLADAYAMVKVLYEKGSTSVVVVVNMASTEAEGREAFDKLNTLVVRFLKRPIELIAVVPSDPEIPRSVKRQRVLLLDHPGRTASLRIVSAARSLAGLPPIEKKSGFFTRFFRSGEIPAVGAKK